MRLPDGSPIYPQEDGKTHVNAYSKSSNYLGRLLSNFAHTPFVLEDYGPWASIEGLWYALSLGSENWDEMRQLHGFAAKKRGRELRGSDYSLESNSEFRLIICAAAVAKVQQNQALHDLFYPSRLPIVHYYVTNSGKAIFPEKGGWLWDFYNLYRKDSR